MAYKLALGLTFVILSGCTSLSTSSDRLTDKKTMATTGVPYALPMLQYELKITRALTQCSEPNATPAVKISVKAEATPKYVQGETYLIDYQALAGWTKVTSLGLDYHEGSGTLKSINAAAEDRSAEIIGSLTRSIVGVASIAAGIPIPGATGAAAIAPPQRMLVCAAGSQAKLDDVASKTVDLKLAKDALEPITEAVNALTEQLRLNALSDADKGKLTDLIRRQRDQMKVVASAQAKLEKAQSAISVISLHRWPDEFVKLDELFTLQRPDLAKLASLLTQAALTPSDNGNENACGEQDNPLLLERCVADKTQVFVTLAKLLPNGDGQIVYAGVIDPNSSAGGIFIRPPVHGRLLACQVRAQRVCTENSRYLILRTDDAVIPQLGQLRFLPFKNGMFQNNSLSVVLRPNGMLEKLEYKDPKARGELAAATLANTVGQFAGYADALRAQRDQEAASAAAAVSTARAKSLAELEFERDRLLRQAEVDQLTNGPVLGSLAAIEAETEQTLARAALLQAHLSERNARAALIASGG